MLASLCIALTTVFALSAAHGVVDRFQHETGIAHHHSLSLNVLIDDDHAASTHHHHGADSDNDHEDREDDAAALGDHGGGFGHHHADTPPGALTEPSKVTRTVAALRLDHPVSIDRVLKDVSPGGLERPPNALIAHA